MEAQTAGEQKRLSHHIRRSVNVVDWGEVAPHVLFKANVAKYKQNPELKEVLLQTHGKILVECSPTDRNWGIGLSLTDSRRHDHTQWRGENKFGYLLTKMRNIFCSRNKNSVSSADKDSPQA